MVRDWTIDMNKVDVFVCQYIVITGISFFNAELISNCIQFGFVPTTDGSNVCIGVRLVFGMNSAPKPRPIMATCTGSDISPPCFRINK